MILVNKTNHPLYNSKNPIETARSIETYDGCKTCSAKKKQCKICKNIYSVCGVDGLFYSLELAKTAETRYNDKMKEFIPNWDKNCCDVRFFISDNELFAEVLTIFLHKSVETNNFFIDKCIEKDTDEYKDIYKKVVAKLEKSKNCKCFDKLPLCITYGCNNSECYYKMTNNIKSRYQNSIGLTKSLYTF